MTSRARWLTALAVTAPAPPATAADLDLMRAAVLAPPGLAGPERQAVRMLVEEVEKRSWAEWQQADAWPADATPVVLVGPADGVRRLAAGRGVHLPDGPGPGREGYRIGVGSTGTRPVVWIAGEDGRGTLFGVGRLLRELRMERRRVTLPADFHAESAPRTPLRGHQLGYRPKTNSYDGWNVAEWEQYFRDLIVFGCNAVELIPPRSDDDADSPHFPLPPLRMMTEMSHLANDYGLDVWVWYPAMDRDYADPKTVEFALKEWGEVFRGVPRLDAVFVPGGDPGHTQPKVLFELLEKQTANLRSVHTKAQMWMSPQSFTQLWMDEFYQLMKQEPAWLSGLVYGPQVRVTLPALRAAVPARYPIRSYPDVTHSRHCQYPVPDWDVAFAATEGREVSNPRPLQMASIFRYERPHFAGFITYSEGCHDDVNKCVWSALGWDEQADVRQVLREYARYFIGPAFEEAFADGLLGLERDWQGPALANAGIDTTLEAFRAMERAAGPAVKRNWRFQQALYRAYFDGCVRGRLRRETEVAEAGRAKLREVKSLGALRAAAEADELLGQAAADPLRARTAELAEALFQSIHAQLSVRKYQAIGIERGATLDTIDAAVSEIGWLRKEAAAVRALNTEAARLARIESILNRTDAGPGGFYDALGDPARRPHLVPGVGWEGDPAYFATPLTGFSFRSPGPDPTRPRAWWSHAESLYDAPLQLRYSDLDRAAAYRVRVVYPRERLTSKVRLAANGGIEIHGYLGKPFEPLEFDVPPAATTNGELTLTWTQEPGVGGAGRGCQVCEVWLFKKTP